MSLRNTRALSTVFRPLRVISLVPLAHNFAYGGKFTILPTRSEKMRDLTVGEVLTAPGNREVLKVLQSKAELFFNREVIASAGASLTWPIFLFAVLWLTGFAFLGMRQRRSSVLWALLAVPIGYLSTIVLCDVMIYFPRQIVAFNLALGLFGTTVTLVTLNPSGGVSADKSSKVHDPKRTKSRR